MKIVSTFSLLLLVLITSNCATLVSRADYEVMLETDYAPVRVEVRNERHELVHSVVTPAKILLPASSGYFKPAKYSLETPHSIQNIKGTIDPWYFGNLFIGGVPGGAFLDPFSGAMWKLKDVYKVQ